MERTYILHPSAIKQLSPYFQDKTVTTTNAIDFVNDINNGGQEALPKQHIVAKASAISMHVTSISYPKAYLHISEKDPKCWSILPIRSSCASLQVFFKKLPTGEHYATIMSIDTHAEPRNEAELEAENNSLVPSLLKMLNTTTDTNKEPSNKVLSFSIFLLSAIRPSTTQ